jgi:hypothetical protein
MSPTDDGARNGRPRSCSECSLVLGMLEDLQAGSSPTSARTPPRRAVPQVRHPQVLHQLLVPGDLEVEVAEGGARVPGDERGRVVQRGDIAPQLVEDGPYQCLGAGEVDGVVLDVELPAGVVTALGIEYRRHSSSVMRQSFRQRGRGHE